MSHDPATADPLDSHAMDDHVSRTIATYNAFAADWVEIANNPAIDDWVKDSMRKFAATMPISNVLVPGCGDGRDSQYLTTLGNDVDSFDLSSEMIEIASRKPDAGRFRLMDLRDLGTLDSRYGGVFASGCLYHLTRAEFRQFIAATAALLVDAGVFYLNMKLGEGSEMRRIPKNTYPGGKIAQERLRGDRFYAYYTEADLDSLLLKKFRLLEKRLMQPHTEAVIEYFLVIR